MGSRLVKIIVPRGNQRDVLAAETMLGALADARLFFEPFALELAATPEERMFLVRGGAETVEMALAQIRQAYPQCEIEELPPERDPAALSADARCRRGFELRLREPAYLPIRSHISREGRTTNDDFGRQMSDPMTVVLAAMTPDGDSRKERCVTQYILRPASDDWSKYWRGAASDVGERAKVTPTQMAITLLSAGGPFLIGLGLMLLVMALVGRQGLFMLLLSALAMALGIGALIWRFRLPSPPDPVLVKQKTSQAAFHVWARVFAIGPDESVVAARLERVRAAFGVYNLAGANGFVFEALPEDLRPQTLDFSGDPFLERLPFVGFVRPPTRQLPILSVGEMAVLWHLPHSSAGLQGVAYTASRRLMPLPEMVSDGVWIGQSTMQGRSIPVRLARESLRGNIGLVAKTQSGKSNLMAVLTLDVLRNDPDAAVVVIDPHRTLAQSVAAAMPPERVDRTIYWSLADRERPFGLNLLDRMNLSPFDAHLDKRVSDIIDAFREIWPDNWGPRMEDYLRGPLLTLAHANEGMVANWRFDEWRAFASAALAGNQERILSGRLDDAARSMLKAVFEQMNALPFPPRPSAQGILRLCLDVARRVGDVDSASDALLAASATELMALVQSPDLRRSGDGERLYGNPPRPLQHTLLDVNAMLLSRQSQLPVRANLAEDKHWHIRDWWRNSYDAYIQINPRLLLDMITPVVTKMNRFKSSDVARRIFGQPESTISVADVLLEGGVLLVDLAAGAVGQETAALIGSTLLNWIASIIFSRAAENRPARRVFIVVDEFQSIPGADYTFMLSELAKYGAQLCMGTQSLRFLDQVSKKTRSAWLDNTNALFVFRCGAEDAEDMAREMSISTPDQLTVTPSDIVGLPDYACFARVRDARRSPTVFHVETRKVEQGDPDIFARIVAQSRDRYGRPAAEVDAWLRQANLYHGPADLVAEAEGVSLPVAARPAAARPATARPDEALSPVAALAGGEAPARNGAGVYPQRSFSPDDADVEV